MSFQSYLKAFYAAVIAGLGATATAYVTGGNHIGFVQGIFIATTALVAFGGVWGVPNAPQTPTPPQA